MPKDIICRTWSTFYRNVIWKKLKRNKYNSHMKKFFWIVMMGPLAAWAQGSGEAGLLITGKVQGIAENSKIFLTDANNPADTLAQTLAKAGQFVLSAHLSEPNLYEVNFGSAKKKIPLFIGNDKISMAGSVEDLKLLTVSGSPTND